MSSLLDNSIIIISNNSKTLDIIQVTNCNNYKICVNTTRSCLKHLELTAITKTGVNTTRRCDLTFVLFQYSILGKYSTVRIFHGSCPPTKNTYTNIITV